MSPSKILFGISGSIACFKAMSVISALVKLGHEVKVVATPSSLKFVGPATIEGLTGHPPFSDVFETGRMMDHIDLARWADVAVIAPTSASLLAKLSLGIADDPVSTTLLAMEAKKPVFIAPAMNTVMWEKPVVQDNVATLRAQGYKILWPGSGLLACGEVGNGRMMEVDDILQSLAAVIAPAPTQNAITTGNGKRILITAGGTREPIDGVRWITNFSTGKTATHLALLFAQTGAQVTLLAPEGMNSPSANGVHVKPFSSYASLEKSLQAELGDSFYDVIIHAAAVSDYSVDSVSIDGQIFPADNNLKIPSSSELQIQLKKNAKLLPRLRSWSKNRNIKVAGFKLTHGLMAEEERIAAVKLLGDGGADLVIHNDLSDVQQHGFAERTFQVFQPNTEIHVVRSVENLLPVIFSLMATSNSPEVSHDVVP